MVAAIAGFSTLSTASAQSSDGVPMMLPVDPAPLVFGTDAGEQEFSIEIADDERERSAGLMFRTSMSDRHGMLFVFRVFDRMSYALILSVQTPVNPGDRFTQP